MTYDPMQWHVLSRQTIDANMLIDRMDHITRCKNDSICHQHETSDSFYIVVKGSAVATIDDETGNEVNQLIAGREAEEEKSRTVAETLPEQIEVGRIDVLGCFGEGSL